MIDAIVFLAVGYLLLLVLAGCTTRRAKDRHRAEREQDRKDGVR